MVTEQPATETGFDQAAIGRDLFLLQDHSGQVRSNGLSGPANSRELVAAPSKGLGGLLVSLGESGTNETHPFEEKFDFLKKSACSCDLLQ